jgi:hypothetical protein
MRIPDLIPTTSLLVDQRQTAKPLQEVAVARLMGYPGAANHPGGRTRHLIPGQELPTKSATLQFIGQQPPALDLPAATFVKIGMRAAVDHFVARRDLVGS